MEPRTGINSVERIAGFAESIVWTAGEDGLETFYIYGLLAADDRIFAFSEGRIGRRDQDPHHIVLKISRDDGATWGQNRILVESEKGLCFSNPTPVFCRATGEIFLFYARNDENDRSKLMMISSADAGLTWSEPRNLTALFDDNQFGWTLHLPGPGHGIEMRSGRLLIQVWHRRTLKFPAAQRNYGVSVIYSDDAGATWHNGGIVPLGNWQLNESRIVELPNGDLILSARSGAFVTSPRYFSRSTDGGATWTEPAKIESLAPAFATDGGFVHLPRSAGDFLILTQPGGLDERKNLKVYFSSDQGAAWGQKTIYAGFAGYSDAVILPDETIGVIYGRDLLDPDGDVEGNARQTVFARFDFNWLTTKE